jgi:cytochrome c
MKILVLVAGAMLSLGVAGSALADDGAALYTKHLCNTCHGPDGKGLPGNTMYPKLAGQIPEYMLTQFNDIKSGKRNNGLTVAMKAMVANVPEADAKAIVEWLATQ